VNIVVVCGSVALGLCLALLLGLHRKLDALPARVWSIAKQERARDESHAQTALREATAAKVGTITSALRLYEEEIGERSRAQVAEAEKRARVAERRLADAGTALEAGAVLVRELRALLDELHAKRAPDPKPAGAAQLAAPQAAETDERKTMEAPAPVPSVPPHAAGDRDSEEFTTVLTRPVDDLEVAS